MKPPRPSRRPARRAPLSSLVAALIAAVLVGAGVGPVAAQPLSAAGETPLLTSSTSVDRLPGLGESHEIDFDSKSMTIDGEREYIWSAEFHYWRLPSVSLWRDVLQKVKANGYNAVSVYFNWNFHSPEQGVYDFTGLRDVEELLDIAEETGLYVIARPGPYINAETTRGGFPGWLVNVEGRARTDAPDYQAAADEWLTAIDGILSKRQYTDGAGPVVLYQIENELFATGEANQRHMKHLGEKVRADGITVPIFHNDFGRDGRWVPEDSSTVPGTLRTEAVDMYAFDAYTGGPCPSAGDIGPAPTVADFGLYGSGGATGGSSASPNTPGFVAEYGNGWFDYWGSSGTYACTAERQGNGYERVAYGTNIINGLSLQSFYMTFGGTSWGWLPAAVVYSSYDYGSAIDEARQQRPKMLAMKQMGFMLDAVKPLASQSKADPVVPSSDKVRVYHNSDTETGTHFYFAAHNPSNGTTNDAFTFPLNTPDGSYTVPQAGTLRLNGQDAKLLVSNYDLERQRLVYSTSEVMTHLQQGPADVAVLQGRTGEDGETVLRYSSEPKVTVVSGQATSTWDAARGDLRLNYAHNGLTEIRIEGGGKAPLTLLIADAETSSGFWVQDTPNGRILEHGPNLVRTADVAGSTLALTGDTKKASTLRVWAPPTVTAVTWNGQAVPTGALQNGSLTGSQQLAGPSPISLPALSGWKSSPGTPEALPGFDDSAWAVANRTTTTSTTKPPAGQPVLTADDYGFHQGDIWYRGKLSATDLRELSFYYGGGGAGMIQVWVDGVYLGQNVVPTGASWPQTTATARFAVPEPLRNGDRTVSVMVRNNSRNQDGSADDFFKEGRGIISFTPTGTVTKQPVWKIQGTQGGEKILDQVRGIANVGGSYGERKGWNLPGFPDLSWRSATVPATAGSAGTTWYRTSFDLAIPAGHDASLGLTIGDPSTSRSNADYRALLYVNGWNIGQYVANVGPQGTFVVPNGVLDPNGKNTLAVQVTSNGGAGNGLEKIELTDLGTVRGGTALELNNAPGWSSAVYGEATAVASVSTSSVATASGLSGQPVTATATLTNDGGTRVSALTTELVLPNGWTAVGGATRQTAAIEPGASATVSWQVTAPYGAAPGVQQLIARTTSNGTQLSSGVVRVELQDRSSFPALEAENATRSSKTFGRESGTTEAGTAATAVGGLGAGDWLTFSGVDLGTGVSGLVLSGANAASPSGPARMEVRRGGATGELLTTLNFQNTGSSWSRYASQRFDLTGLSGVQEITIVSLNGSIALDSLRFQRVIPDSTPVLQAESADRSSKTFGRETGKTADGAAAIAIGGIGANDWVSFTRTFDKPVTGVVVSGANASTPVAPARVEVRRGSATGELLTTLSFLPTGSGWSTYSSQRFDLAGLVGLQDVTFVSLNGSLALDSVRFLSDTATAAPAATASARCLAGKIVLTATATNTGTEATTLKIASPHGTKSFDAVQPGKTVTAAFTVRAASIGAGEVTVTSTTTAGLTASTKAPYSAASCK
jgi:beta-galactosidase GanA